MAALVLQSVARRPAISLSRVPHETVGRAYVCLKYLPETSVHSNDLSRGGGDVVLCYGSPRLGVPERFYARVTCTGEGRLVGNCGGLAREEGEVEWRGKA